VVVSTHPGTVGELLDKLPPVEGEARTVRIDVGQHAQVSATKGSEMPDTILATEQKQERNFIVQGPRQRSAQWGDLMIALAKAQGEIEGAKKDSEAIITGQTKRKYADLASVWAAIREPLAKNGLAIMQWPRVTENGVEIETIVAHGEQFISDVLWMPCAQMNAHGIGSAITYGRRYALMAVAGVAPEDDDGDGAMDRSGVPGSAGGGQDFRPPGPRKFQGKGNGWVDDALRDGLIPNGDTRSRYEQGKDATRKQPVGREATPEQARAAKIKAKTDERIAILKNRDGGWTRDTLDQFWRDDAKWREWMADPANEALADYERYTTAFTEAQDALQAVS
jgi:hypothetical protein